MKIASSMIQMSAEHYSQEQEQKTVEIQGREAFRGRELPGAPVRNDRVSLNSYSSRQVQSTYTGAMTSNSRVRHQGDDGGQAFFQQRMIERLTSAVTGRHLSIGNSVDTREVDNSMWSAVISPESREPTAWIRETVTHAEDEQMSFSSRGSVQTDDGRIIDFTLDLSMSRTLYSQTYGQTQLNPAVLTDPLVISLDGMPPKLADTRFEFDLDADGTMDEISFVARGSGFLAFDKNKDGTINDGSELFGPASGDGFEDLALYDEDGNGWIDENDGVFSQLSVWTRDDDGKDRLVSLKDAGLGAIFLGSVDTPFDLKGEDNQLRGRTAASGIFLFENGNVGSVQQVDLDVGTGQENSGNKDAFSLQGSILQPAFGSAFNFQPVTEDPFAGLRDSINDLRERLRLILEGVDAVSGRPVQGSL